MKLEPYLSDERVGRVAEKLGESFPVLREWNTDFVTGIISPPWHGLLPDGTTGWTTNEVVQFIVVSDHPRPLQRRMGVRHATTGAIWPAAFQEAAKEESHYVVGETVSAEERIFSAVLAKHITEMNSLASIQQDAVANENGPKSALEAL